MRNDVATVIQRGVDTLDTHFGDSRDWIMQVNPDTLELMSSVACVLGQVFGRYSTGNNELGLYYTQDRVDRGFTGGVTTNSDGERVWIDFEELNAGWQEFFAEALQPA